MRAQARMVLGHPWRDQVSRFGNGPCAGQSKDEAGKHPKSVTAATGISIRP